MKKSKNNAQKPKAKQKLIAFVAIEWWELPIGYVSAAKQLS